jgi:DNA modification methylase
MLIRADARQLPLRDRCVQCVVTSPPYFGLRDYGTARWEGGDPDCQHIGMSARTVSGGPGKQYTNAGSNRVYSGDCACGARRMDSQIGLEATPDAYVQTLVEVFREVRRVLTDDGVCWLNLGDSYAGPLGERGDVNGTSPKRASAWDGVKRPTAKSIGMKTKDLLGIPWRVAFAVQADGWYLRSDVIWAKPNPMPESVTDRPTKAHEYLFLLSKCERYFYDADAISEELSTTTIERFGGVPARTGGNGWDTIARSLPTGKSASCGAGNDGRRNRRTVWTIPTMPYSGAHFATMPEKLVEPCILAGSRLGDCVCDPFMGSGTVGAVAERLSRRWVGMDLNAAYHALAKERTAQLGFRFDEVSA